MLIDFRVANFRSFKEEQALSLVASSDDAHPDNLISGNDFSLLKTGAIYGKNGSGKSNLIRAMRVMEQFIRRSATSMNIGDEIPNIVPFRLDKKSQKQPSFFEISVVIEKTRYEYGFSATAERVHDEWLIAYPPTPSRKSPGQTWFERRYDPKTKETTWKFRTPFKKSERTLLEEQTRDNGLALSRGAEMNIKPLSELYLWFLKNLWIFDLSEHSKRLIEATAKSIQNNKETQELVAQLIRHADIGIDEIAVKKVPDGSKLAPQDLLELLSDKGKKNIQFGFDYEIRTSHRVSGSKKVEWFDLLSDESNGTQRFFALIGPFLDALDKGTVMVVDELECSMHPLLTRKLIELFHNPKVNHKGAQLIFATHDSTLMDQELFRRDQVWITEKNSRGATELYSLYDLKDGPRSTTSFQKNYLAGRYGGIPNFGPAFEELKIK